MISLAILIIAGADSGFAEEFASALDRAREAANRRQYERVIEILTPYNNLTDPETEYVVAAEIGRAHFHLGRYDTAYRAFRTAVRIHPERVETAIFLEAAAYLVGNTGQAYLIFQELVTGGARDLYLAVTLPGARKFLVEPKVVEILHENAVALPVDAARGSVFDLRFGGSRRDVANALGAPFGESSARSMTAQAGPAVIWEFVFDFQNRLIEVVLQVEHLELYTPYRLELGGSTRLQTTPAALVAVLGSPHRTDPKDDGTIVMEWLFEGHKALATFGRPEIRLTQTPPGSAILRTLHLRAITAHPLIR